MDNLPHDLADVLKILHEWQPMHTEGHLVSIPGNVPLLNLRLSLPHDINAFPFSKYASRHIRDHRLGITQDPLRLPFLPKHSSQDNRDSLEIFTLILSYMFERRLSEDRRMVLADYIIQKGLSVESLRDEIYVQLINQTIGKGPDSAWLLLASCLSTFAPSTTLAKHLLKYVSDAGVDGFDAVCQQKLLQCYGLEPELSRSYPPCLLEWTTNRLKAAMALYAGFSDGEKGVCQVESWTTGEQFAINMFRSRHINENLKGWSVQLRDDVDTYECAGYDYVLDLVSEMELPPSFPCMTAYFLTMTDISRPASTTRRHWPDEPHNAEKLRIMPLEVDELRDQPVAALPVPVPLPQSPPPPSPSPPPKRISFVEEPPKPSEDVYGKANGALPKGSALNQRKDHVPDELSKTSRLNSRYSQGHTQADTSRAPAEPVKHNHVPHQPAKQRHVQPPVADEPPARRRNRPASQQPQQQQQQHQQPQKPAGEGEDMSAWLDSVFREALSGGGAGGAGGAGGGGHGGLGNPQAVSRNMKGGEEDMSAWVDSVFQEALSGAGGAGSGAGRGAGGREGGRQGGLENPRTESRNVMDGEEDMSAWLDSVFREALSGAGGGQGGLGDAHAVSRNMKGGEDNLQQTQYGLVGGAVSGSYGLNSFGIQSAAGAGPASSTVFPSSVLQAQSAALSQLSSGMPTVITQTAMPPALPVVVDPAMQLMHQQQFIQQQQQQQQQQLHQQQQQQQQLLQHLRLQHQQQIQMHQHAAELQVQLQTKELEKQVLQSTIHAEMLKQQLQHLQDSKHPQPQKGQQQQQQQAPQQSQQQQQQQPQQPQQQQQVSQQVQQQHQQLLHQQRPQSSTTTSSSSSSSAAVVMRHSFASADDHHSRPVRPVIINSGSYIHPAVPETRQRVPGEVDESRPGGVQTLKRSYLTKSISDPKPIPLPAVAKQVTAVAIANNRARQPVKFADNIIEESSEDEDAAAPAPPRPPSPPIVKKENKTAAAARAPQKMVIIETKPVKRTPSAAQVIKPAAAVVVTKTVVTRTVNAPQETNGEVEDGPRKPPGKIGIKWPPEPEKTEKQTIPVNRLVIMETKEEQMAIRKAQSAEDIQQKINNRIRSSQQAAEREVPAPPPVRRPPPPAAVTKTSEVQMEEAGTQVQSWNNKIDMATKKKELETLLKDAQWGTQNRKESPVAPPPVHHPPPPVAHESQSAYDLSRLDSIRTVLHAQCTSPFYAYKNVPWSLEIRKEVFSPSENLNNPVLVDIVFAQIATDVLSGDSIRITQDDKRKMRKILDTHGVNLRNIGTGHSTQAKKAVIKAAKELPIFFARIFPVNGGSKQSRVQMVAVSHSGVRLLARHKDVFDDYIIVFEQIKFSDVIDVHVPKSSTILMRLTGRNIVMYTKYASQLCGMLNSYRQEHSEIIPKIRINDNDDDDD